MSIQPSLLLDLSVIIGSALGFSLLAWKLRIPTALGQLMAGIIIGPFGLKFITNTATIEGVAEIGIVLLLFVVGLELNPFQLKQIGAKVLIFSLVEITVSFIGGLLMGLMFRWSISESLLLGGVVSVSSTAIIVSLLHERRALAQSFGRLIVGALVIEDIFAIGMLSLMPSFANGGLPSLSQIVWLIARGILLVVLVYVFSTYLAPRIIDRMSHIEFDVDDSGFLLSVVTGFAMAAISYELGFSAGTGAFLVGLFIVGKRARFIYERIYPIRTLFIIIFFVSMGMLVDLSVLLNPAIFLPVVGLAVIGKCGGSYLGAILSANKASAGDIAIDMNPRGEFSLILAREASRTGLSRAMIYPIAGTVVLATTVISAYLRRVRQTLHAARKKPPSNTKSTFSYTTLWKIIHS